MNLGIIVPHFGASQITYESVKLANNTQDTILFFEQLISSAMPINCPTMCVNELMNFRGVLISSNIENTLMAHKLINPKWVKLIFYVWDLEWLRPNKNNYLYNFKAYNTPDVLMCRQEHVAPITNYCNRQPIMREFQDVKRE